MYTRLEFWARKVDKCGDERQILLYSTVLITSVRAWNYKYGGYPNFSQHIQCWGGRVYISTVFSMRQQDETKEI